MPAMRKSAAIAAATTLAALAAGCGEKDEPETTGPVVPVTTTSTSTSTGSTTTATGQAPATPEAVVEAFLSSPDADLVCDELITEKFLRASYGDRAGCVAGRKPASLASQATLSAGPDDVVTAEPQGGVYDGDELAFTLVPSGGGFAIDSVRSDAPVGP